MSLRPIRSPQYHPTPSGGLHAVNTSYDKLSSKNRPLEPQIPNSRKFSPQAPQILAHVLILENILIARQSRSPAAPLSRRPRPCPRSPRSISAPPHAHSNSRLSKPTMIVLHFVGPVGRGLPYGHGGHGPRGLLEEVDQGQGLPFVLFALFR